MSSSLSSFPKIAAVMTVCMSLISCQNGTAPTEQSQFTGGAKPSGTVRIALLVPSGGGDPKFEGLAESLEKGARLAVADLERSGTNLMLDIYPTSGTPAGASEAADNAIASGADIIVGPLRGPSTPPVAAKASQAGIAVLGLSNNTRFAGGNVFLLGRTFENSANRLVSYAASQGKLSIMVLHAENAQGRHGLAAIREAAEAAGASVVCGNRV